MCILVARRVTSGLSSPEIKLKTRPALRARDSPMMSAKQKRFHSSPFGPHQMPPSVRTPSTSIAMALILGIGRADSPQLLDDRVLAFQNPLDAVTHGFLNKANVADQTRDS